MHRVAGPGGLISSNGRAPQNLPFYYRLGNGGTLSAGLTYSCTLSGGWPEDTGCSGYPSSIAPPWFIKSVSLKDYANSVIAGTPTVPDFTIPPYGYVFYEGEDPYTGTWGINSAWDAALAEDSNAYGVLHSFTAYGAVGQYYLVDYLGCIEMTDTPAGVWTLPPATVGGIMDRPYRRGKGTVQAVLSRWGNFAIEDAAYYRFIPDGSFGEGSPVTSMRAYAPGGDNSSGPDAHGRMFSPEPFAMRETTAQRGWPGPQNAAATLEQDGATVPDFRLRGANFDPVAIAIDFTSSNAEYLMFLDVIATVAVTTVGQAATVGLNTGIEEKVAPYSRLGILFQPAWGISAPAHVCGRVRLMV